MIEIEKCIQCKKCIQECSFLGTYGTPLNINNLIREKKLDITIGYECSLCSLCEAVCPEHINIKEYFLTLRIQCIKTGKTPEKKFKSLLNYEKYSASKIFRYYFIPENCSKVFFTGCAFTGKSPEMIMELYNYIKSYLNDNIGFVIDCCFKISHDLGYIDMFSTQMDKKNKIFIKNNIKEIITVCPSCTEIFEKYTSLKVVPVYEYLKEKKFNFSEKVTVHDPCVLRNDEKTQETVRHILKKNNIKIKKVPHEKSKTFCCGEGGGVRFINKEFVKSWKKKRLSEVNNTIITYCYGCKIFLKNKKIEVYHILDLLFNNFSSISPIGYWINRWKLKRKVKALKN